MRKPIVLAVTLFALALGWLNCASRRAVAPVIAAPQALTTKSNLISLIRQDATDLLAVRARIRQHRASFDALGFTFVDGDFIGDNSGITAAQFTTAVTNLTAVVDGFDLGGTLAVGIPTNINRIARLGN